MTNIARRLFEIPSSEISDTKAMMTIYGGRTADQKEAE